MSGPLSVTASVATLISLGIQVTQSLVDFYISCKHQNSDLISTTKKLESLLDTFQHLEKILANRKFQGEERNLIEDIEKTIKNCEESIVELQEEWQKFYKTSSNGIKTAVKVAARRVTYPFRQSTLQKLDEDISDIRANLSFTLDVLHLKDDQRAQDDISDIKSLLDLVRTSQVISNIADWLKAPDATINHNAACAKKHPGSGTWLIKKSPVFTTWLTEENSLLWLSGFAGSGKSVLSSTVIQFIFRYRKSDPRIGIGFFYFTFSDKSKQDESAMLRALLLQLSSQLQDGHRDLIRLYDNYRTSTPPSPVLLDYLQRLFQKFDHIYLVLDALDESPRNRLRDKVLNTLEAMRNWGLKGLHLLVTSRDELDIRDSLDPSPHQRVTMQNAGVDNDITNFICGRFDEDRKLRKWLPYRGKIQETLSKRAQGVYVKSPYSVIMLKYRLTILQISISGMPIHNLTVLSS